MTPDPSNRSREASPGTAELCIDFPCPACHGKRSLRTAVCDICYDSATLLHGWEDRVTPQTYSQVAHVRGTTLPVHVANRSALCNIRRVSYQPYLIGSWSRRDGDATTGQRTDRNTQNTLRNLLHKRLRRGRQIESSEAVSPML